MAVKQFRKLQYNEAIINSYVELLKGIKMPFTMEISNYTCKIISDGYNLHFLKKEQSNMVFAAHAKIKSDIKNIPIPDIDMSRNSYYNTDFKGEVFYADTVWNIDIKNAYPSIMLNAGFIKQPTFDYLNRMQKLDKLAALGMLASRKEIYIHNANGVVIKEDERINPLSNFFFYCVQECEKAIQECKNLVLMEAFLFSWVDGIYYNNHNREYHILTQQHLKQKFNLESTLQQLKNFEVKLNKNFYQISFTDEKNREKVFNIPLPEPELKKRIINYLLTKKYDK